MFTVAFREIMIPVSRPPQTPSVSLEDEMSKFERELKSLQQVKIPAPLVPNPSPQIAFTPHVLMRSAFGPTVPLAPPPQPPPIYFAATRPMVAPRVAAPMRPVASNIFAQASPLISRSTLPISGNSIASNSNLARNGSVIDASQSHFNLESNNRVIESSPSIYKTPKQPNPVSVPGPVPIAPQIKNPQPVTLPPDLAASLNAPCNNQNNNSVPDTATTSKTSQSSGTPGTSTGTSTQATKPNKPKKFIRHAGGESWEDVTLNDWDLNDYRVFCGDLGNEVTDDHLRRAFSQYPSLQKVKVVRDKRSNKTKGYGFLSFSDSIDYVRAMKEMNGKYVGNRPIKLRKSSWQERDIHQVRKKEKLKKKLGLR